MNRALLQALEAGMSAILRERIAEAAGKIVAVKERGGKVVVVTGSGPNIHEGVTTLIAELMRVGLVDGVTTSAAVVAHEMAGTLDRVKRCRGASVGVDARLLPRGGEFELTLMEEAELQAIGRHLPLDWGLIARLRQAEGKTIIKAAGNLGYPMGWWIEHQAQKMLEVAQARKVPVEEVAGASADERTMIGMGAKKNLPVLVTIPQLIGGGMVGLCIGDSIPLAARAERLARMLDSADLIIESGVALTQEIHDGPFETYTGHGLWSGWQRQFTYSLQAKTLIRIDLDPNLERVWEIERSGGKVQEAIAAGLPKTKLFDVPFRMEMSGFARLEGSLPLIGDLGVVWPVMIGQVVERLGLGLQFMSYPQQTEAGQAMREFIVCEVKPIRQN